MQRKLSAEELLKKSLDGIQDLAPSKKPIDPAPEKPVQGSTQQNQASDAGAGTDKTKK